MIALPPSESGAVQETEAEALPAVAVTPVGAPGAVSTTGAVGVTLFDGAEVRPAPAALLGVTVKV